MKKFLSILIASIMLMCMISTAVFADDPDPVTKTFDLTKEFVGTTGYDSADATIADIEDKVQTDATFVIASYKSFNREVGKTAIPEFSPSSYTIPVSTGTSSITITTPDYSTAGVGDYWYTVTEQAINNIAGVAIDTVSTKYLHVQVVWDNTAPDFTKMKVAAVTLHNDAPLDDGTYNTYEINTAGSDKTTGFTNTYGAGSLEITKALAGNMADPDKLFAVNITFTAPTGKSVMSDISYIGGFADENGATAYTAIAPGTIAKDWTSSRTVTVYLKKDVTVTFSNIPAGVTYKIAESDYGDDGYTTEYAVTNNEAEDVADNTTNHNVTGSISDSLDTVTITNTKTVAIDVGVILNNAPFVILLIGSIAFLAVYFVTNRRKEEEY